MKHSIPTQPKETTFQDARLTKGKDETGQYLDLNGQAFKEHSYEQQNAMSPLNGLVVHGAACASLLALGNMAAVGLASSGEILLEKALPIIPEAGFIGRWPATVNSPESLNQHAVKVTPKQEVALPTVAVNDELSESFTQQVEISGELKADNITEMATRYSDVMMDQSALLINDIPLISRGVDGGFTFYIKNKAGESVIDSTSHDNQPIFSGISERDSLIEIFNQDGRVLATTSADSRGYWSIELPYTLPDGQYTFTLYSTNPKGERKLVADKVLLEIVANHELIEAQGQPSLTLVPLIESDEVFLTVLQDFKTQVSSPAQTVDLDLSELLVINESDLFSALNDNKQVDDSELSGLEDLLHPDGCITLWAESEFASPEYASATGTKIDLDSLLSNPLDTEL